jgi:hypothetical protein
MMQASVVICTLNPRHDVFPRVLAALASQTLPAAAWEVVIIDNGSTPPLASGDTDCVLTCLDNGVGSGRFTALHLTHVIPAGRLEFAYQRQLARDIGWSWGGFKPSAARPRSAAARSPASRPASRSWA